VSHISLLLSEDIKEIQSISGGDISMAYKLYTSKNNYFLKLNSSKNALDLFLSEKIGLDAIAKTNTIRVPEVFYCDNIENEAFILMQYIEVKTPSSKDYEELGHQLAALHKVSNDEFGFEQDNFIGNLPQSNTYHNHWATFYIEERILPQLELAQSKQLLSTKDIPDKEKMYEVCKELFQDITPSLLHGDLWSGNYLIATDSTPFLIDPAVYYGHHEVDIAMSKLFGGFSRSFYDAYQAHFPFTNETDARIDVYQLYYLLVHLNLFGTSYLGSVRNILNNYF